MLVLLVLFFLGLILPTSTMAKPESISWSDLTVRIREGNGEYKHILKMEYEGAVYHGRLLGILGPSGAGKSTFLNLLSGRMKESNTYAQTLAQEALISSNITPALHGQEVAYIHQDDSFFSMLSVMETLDFASQMRLPSESAMTQRSAIEESIQTMSLLTVRDTAVGDPLGKRGISGGERKRLSVACELLSKPKLLIADEPTSGLDSYQALSVVSKIKRTVVDRDIIGVTTLHQPRSSIYALLDDLLVLAPGGRVVYHGDRLAALPYLKRLGFACPGDTNPAEHIIDLVSVDYTSAEATVASEARIQKLVAAFAASRTARGPASLPMPATAQAAGTRDHGDAEGNGMVVVRRGMGAVRAVSRSCSRFSLLLKRALRQTLRDSTVNLVRFGVSALLASVIGALYGKQGGGDLSEASVGDRVTIIAQAAIQVSMLTMIKTLQLFKREKPVVGRELASQQYRSVEYLGAKLLSELPMDAAVAAVFGLVVHRQTQLGSGLGDFVGTLALLGCASSSLGLAVGALAPSADVALAIGPALMVVYVILGAIGPTMGGGASSSSSSSGGGLPTYLQMLRAASPIRPACEAMCLAEFSGQPFARPTASSMGLAALRRALEVVPRVLGALLARKGNSSSSRYNAEGDHVIADLGMDPVSSSFAQSRGGLVTMLVVHSVLALLGLSISKND